MNLLRENSVLTHYGRPPTPTNGVVSIKEGRGSISSWVVRDGRPTFGRRSEVIQLATGQESVLETRRKV
jgi:hypothetical protein